MNIIEAIQAMQKGEIITSTANRDGTGYIIYEDVICRIGLVNLTIMNFHKLHDERIIKLKNLEFNILNYDFAFKYNMIKSDRWELFDYKKYQ